MSRFDRYARLCVERERPCERCCARGCDECGGKGAVLKDVEVEVRGVFVEGYPETGPSYACGGEPAEPDNVEDIEASDDGGKTWAFELTEAETEIAIERMLDD